MKHLAPPTIRTVLNICVCVSFNLLLSSVQISRTARMILLYKRHSKCFTKLKLSCFYGQKSQNINLTVRHKSGDT